jgi:hypothetical protein
MGNVFLRELWNYPVKSPGGGRVGDPHCSMARQSVAPEDGPVVPIGFRPNVLASGDASAYLGDSVSLSDFGASRLRAGTQAVP